MSVRQVLVTIFIASVINGNLLAQGGHQKHFEPTFPSLEKSTPVPEWFKDAKFGIYFHWGVYSVPAFANEWYPRNMYIKNSNEYKHHTSIYGDPSEWPYDNFITGAKDKQGNFVQFAPKLKSEGGSFDPNEWAQLFYDAGAKFAGPVAEHHDGFSMWASKVNPWNAKAMGPELDLVGLLSDAIRKKNMKVILSMHHAFNITGFYNAVPPTDDSNLQILYGQQGKEKNEALWLKKHKEIIDNYKPDVIWQDFNLHRISQTVLLEFLSYYYNKATGWKKEVVATYKDGLNTRTGVLDYERGGPADITDNYWLTDDAISNTSWSYTEGLGYYSKKQILHGFLDRISKNGNLLLNISPKADGTIPKEQKEILLAMGSWLKKYGEAVYATRAWEKYGEGPTKMGAAHGVFQSPAEGTAKDVRFTRSKDNTTLYATLLGWEQDQKEVLLTSLTKERIDLKNLKSVQLINGAAGKYLSLKFKQDNDGLHIDLPQRFFEEMAYVLKLKFNGKISKLDKFTVVNTSSHYYIVPGTRADSLVISSNLMLAKKKNQPAFQWKLDALGKGLYRIVSRENSNKVLTLGNATSNDALQLCEFSGKDNQVWKIEDTYYGLHKISNKQFPQRILAVNTTLTEGNKVGLANATDNSFLGWQLHEVCDLKVQAYKTNAVPGTIEAEDFNVGCPGEAYFDRDEKNNGGEYRPNEQVDIEKNEAGGYSVGRTGPGEWLTYTVNVTRSANYQVSCLVASTSENGKLHLEADDASGTGSVSIPNTEGRQNWRQVKATIKLNAGQHVLKLVFDSRGISIDRFIFEEEK